MAILIGARDVFRMEGLAPSLRWAWSRLARFLFRYEGYYLCEYTLRQRNESDFMPGIRNFTFKIVSTEAQADKLAAAGFELPLGITNARYRLGKGAIAFCIFVERKLAHIGWVAMTKEAKKSLKQFLYRVDFSDKEACTGGSLTIPKYRGKGLMTYGFFKRLQFLNEKGIITSRNSVAIHNIATQRVLAKFDPMVYAKARYLKVLWWKSWKEQPLMRVTQLAIQRDTTIDNETA